MIVLYDHHHHHHHHHYHAITTSHVNSILAVKRVVVVPLVKATTSSSRPSISMGIHALRTMTFSTLPPAFVPALCHLMHVVSGQGLCMYWRHDLHEGNVHTNTRGTPSVHIQSSTADRQDMFNFVSQNSVP